MATVSDSILPTREELTQMELLNRLEAQRQQELSEARAIQLGMMPRSMLKTADVTVCFDFQPFHEVGGDFLDFFLLSDETIGVYLGDVTGKGLPAALYAALAVGTLRGVHKTGTEPAAVLGQLNRRLLLHNISHRYAAVQYACFNPRSGMMKIASAGMEGPLLVTAEGCRVLTLQGLPPGMFAHAQYASVEVALKAGDSMVFLSDGWSDTKEPCGEFLGLEPLCEVCGRLAHGEPEEMLQALKAVVARHADGETQQDDRTAAILRYTPR